METASIGWFVIGITLVLAEFMVPGAVLGFLGGAAILTGLLVQLGHITGVFEITMTFFVSSMVFILVLRTALLKLFPDDSIVQNTDETADAIGKIVDVVEDITEYKRGRIKYLDVTWSAQADTDIKKGEQVVITGQDGQCWLVRPIDNDL